MILMTVFGTIAAVAIWIALLYLVYRASYRRTYERLTWGKARIKEIEEMTDE